MKNKNQSSFIQQKDFHLGIECSKRTTSLQNRVFFPENPILLNSIVSNQVVFQFYQKHNYNGQSIKNTQNELKYDQKQNNESSMENESFSNHEDENQKIDRKYFNRSSNNSHKKYSATARKNLFKLLEQPKKRQILELYKSYKSSRIYYFCMLLSAQIYLQRRDLKKFIRGFVKDIKQKIIKYLNEIQNTQNERLKKFRTEQIQDIKNSLLSFKYFYCRSFEQGIQCIYKKSKGMILKLPEYQRSVKIIKQIQQEFHVEPLNADIKNFIDSEISRKIKDFELVLPFDFQPIQASQMNQEVNNQIQKLPEKEFDQPLNSEGIQKKVRHEDILKKIQEMNKPTQDADESQENQNLIKQPEIMMNRFERIDQQEIFFPMMLQNMRFTTSSFMPFGFESLNPINTILPMTQMASFQMYQQFNQNQNNNQNRSFTTQFMPYNHN